MQYRLIFAGALAALALLPLGGCSKDSSSASGESAEDFVTLKDVARLLSAAPLEAAHLAEVHDAVSASAGNGYDEEYRMRDLFGAPGTAVGASEPTKADAYPHPLRDVLRRDDDPAWLDSLALSDVQIYWPFSERWDGSSLPTVTFDPGDGSVQNEGYQLCQDGSVRKVLVTEEMAASQPVWVVNRNTDAEYKSLEIRRREDPSWGSGGGTIVVKGGSDIKTLVLRSFKARRQFDTWFAGASEFFIKLGSVDDFSGSTEGELRLYEPSITDFMVVVRRGQVNQAIDLDAILVSEWREDLESCALMMIEDDGGTRTSWKCNAVVKYNSRSYGVELEIPLNTRDDIVWRGSLSRAFIEKYSGRSRSFGDVELMMELI